MKARAPSQPADLDVLFRGGRVWIMGVLNVTPDSFYAGSRFPDLSQAQARADILIHEGVDVLDIGGESTRPGAAEVPVEEELNRVLPVVESLQAHHPRTLLSVDTQKAEVARQAIDQGAALINDVSALRRDPDMAAVLAETDRPVVLMHMQGTPRTMQDHPHYNDVMDDLKAFFNERLAYAGRQGIREDQILLDPGIGFGKTLEHNMTILNRLSELSELGRPLMVGVSRKSFLERLAGPESLPPENRLEGSLAAALWAVQQGARGLRVHDVGATRRALNVWEAFKTA